MQKIKTGNDILTQTLNSGKKWVVLAFELSDARAEN